MSPRRPIDVVIPARDAAATLGAALDAVLAQRLDAPFGVIVVDDGSDDATAAVAEAAGDRVTVVRRPGGGPGPARNSGAAAADAGALAFLDADCVPAEGWLGAGLRALQSADLVQGRVRPAADPGPFDHTVWVERPSPLYESANLFVRTELFDRLGGFEDWLGAGIGKPLAEDVWFGWRARRAGARIAWEPEALVEHAVIARGPREYVRERLRAAYFPAIVRRIPELRGELLLAGVFLSPRSARFDLALGGVLGALATRSARPLAATLPYLVAEAPRALPHGRRAPLVAAADLAADALGLASLLAGSVHWRTPVL